MRPWYVSAITGPKTTILLVDTSSSMYLAFAGNRYLNAKVTIETIMGTFNNFDSFAAIAFSDSATIVGGMEQIESFS